MRQPSDQKVRVYGQQDPVVAYVASCRDKGQSQGAPRRISRLTVMPSNSAGHEPHLSRARIRCPQLRLLRCRDRRCDMLYQA
jgi:hypothetical protein